LKQFWFTGHIYQGFIFYLHPKPILTGMKNNYQQLLTAFAVFLSVSLSAQVTFTNMGSALGSISGSSYRDCAVDMNGDFLDDIVRVTSTGIFIDFQQPDGTFVQSFFANPPINPPTWSICAADIDGNGFNDLLYGNGSRVSFVMANDNGTAYTEDPRPEYIFSQRSTFADIDNDGHIDAFVCHDVNLSHPYRNDGDGYLVLDQTLIQTLPVGGNYAAVWCDYDNDGDIDLHIAKCRGGAPWGDAQRVNLLYRNNGDGTFSSVGPAANMNDGNQSWTTIFEDFNNNGWFDAFTVNHASGDVPGGAKNLFMQNNQDGTFTDIIASTGINATDLGAWNLDAGDFNNDGFIDIFSELARELYLNNGNGTFTGYDLPFGTGGIGDFNGDGFLDVVRGNNLWINNGNNNNHVMINLQGIFSNFNGIGSRVEIHGAWGIQTREVRAGTSFAPMKSLNTHFGLGQATAIDSLVVLWPSGVRTVINNPAINTTHFIPEASCILANSELSANGSTTICPGETVTLSAPAGFETYQWNNGSTATSITVGSTGNYTATLTDENGCVSLASAIYVEVIQEEVATISINGEDRFCQGGSVILTSSPAAGYEWSNGLTNQSIEVTQSGDYFVMVQGVCGMVESDLVSIEVLPAPAPIVDNVELGEPGFATITATGENVLWYDSEFAIDPIGSGNEFETPFIESSTQFWAESTYIYGGELETGGKPDNSGSGGIPASGAYTYFNVWEPFTINTVRVYVPANSTAGIRNVQLVDGDNNVLQEASFNLAIGEHVIELNFDVPVGNGLSLRCPQNNLFRNNSGVSYPYAIGTVGQMYDTFFGPSYYYYFYDWNIQKEQLTCVSERTPVSVLFTNVETLDKTVQVNIYPNPVINELNIEMNLLSETDLHFVLSDVSGKQVLSEIVDNAVGAYRHQLTLTGLATGVYTLKVQSNAGYSSYKVVVQ
jgi:hypothetical protein